MTLNNGRRRGYRGSAAYRRPHADKRSRVRRDAQQFAHDEGDYKRRRYRGQDDEYGIAAHTDHVHEIHAEAEKNDASLKDLLGRESYTSVQPCGTTEKRKYHTEHYREYRAAYHGNELAQKPCGHGDNSAQRKSGNGLFQPAPYFVPHRRFPILNARLGSLNILRGTIVRRAAGYFFRPHVFRRRLILVLFIPAVFILFRHFHPPTSYLQTR